MSKLWKDKMKGGDADNKNPAQFSQAALAQGRTHEAEHISNKHIQTEVAMDHLVADPDAYKKLDITEKTPLSRLQALRKCMKSK